MSGAAGDTRVPVSGVGLALAGLGALADLREQRPAQDAVDPAAVLGRRGLLYSDRATQLALCAAHEALSDARVLHDGDLLVPGERFGVIASSNLGNVDTVCTVAACIREEGVSATSPMALPNASSNVVASSISIRFGLRGPNLMLCNGRGGGVDAAHLAASLIRAERAERCLVVGVETRNATVAGLLDMEPTELLDGAVALLLESRAAVAARGGRVLGLIGGCATSVDLDRSVERVRPADFPASALWLPPEDYSGETPSALIGSRRCDADAVLERCSGAFGVIQCATALAWLAEGGADAVLVTSGGRHEPFVTLALTAAERAS